MKLELAQELKDKGYPQGKSDKYWAVYAFNEEQMASLDVEALKAIEIPFEMHRTKSIKLFKGVCDSPNLEELIAECGEGFFKLWRLESGEWLATHGRDENYRENGDIGTGDTAVEAASRLWVALQQ